MMPVLKTTPDPAWVDCNVHRILRGPLHSVLNELRLAEIGAVLTISRDNTPGALGFAAEDIPSVIYHDAEFRVLAGRYHGLIGPVISAPLHPFIIDISLDAGAEITLPIPDGHGGLVHALTETVAVGYSIINQGHSGLIASGNAVTITARNKPARVLILTIPA